VSIGYRCQVSEVSRATTARENCKEIIVLRAVQQFNLPTNSVQTDPPQVFNIQGEMNKWFRWHDETNPAASVAVRHLLQELINDNFNFTEYVGRLAALGQTEVPCHHLLEVRTVILRSNPT
jgi:hypothetical protein